MHAVVVKVTINDEEPALEFLRNEIVPRVSQSQGFVSGHWTKSEDGSDGLSMLVFESEDAAQAAAKEIQQPPIDAVNLDNVEVREVVANA
jgi:hypothetical protein